MTWTEIKKDDMKGIEEFCRVQRMNSTYYLENMVTETIYKKFNDSITLRAFIYRDASYEINLCTRIIYNDTMQLRLVGIGNILDEQQGINIILTKIKELLLEYNVNKIYAVYPRDVYPKTLSYYDAISNCFAVDNFKSTDKFSPRDNVSAFNVSHK